MRPVGDTRTRVFETTVVAVRRKELIVVGKYGYPNVLPFWEGMAMGLEPGDEIRVSVDFPSWYPTNVKVARLAKGNLWEGFC